MKKCDSCIRCGSQNIDTLMVNSRLSLNYPKEKHYGLISQKVLNPTDAIVCTSLPTPLSSKSRTIKRNPKNWTAPSTDNRI